MTQEEKDILLKDLCARLPYGVKVKIYDKEILNYGEGEIGIIDGKEVSKDDYFTINAKTDRWIISINEFKPCLRPLSSMTEDEKEEMHELISPEGTAVYRYDGIATLASHFGDFIPYEYMSRVITWLAKNHFDYNGLIPMGLALPAPDGMYNERRI